MGRSNLPVDIPRNRNSGGAGGDASVAVAALRGEVDRCGQLPGGGGNGPGGGGSGGGGAGASGDGDRSGACGCLTVLGRAGRKCVANPGLTPISGAVCRNLAVCP